MSRLFLTGVLALMIAVVPVFAEDAAEERVGDPWPLNVCVVSGEELGSMGDPIIKVQDGREVRFCCAGCVKKLEKTPEVFLPAMDKKIIEDQAAVYPLATCINSGADLGASGGVSFVAGNRLMKTCCKNCKAKVEADPATFITKLDAAVVEAQKADYPLDKCPVGEHALGDDAVDMVVGNRLVRLCCADCKAKVEAEPVKYISMVDAARKG